MLADKVYSHFALPLQWNLSDVSFLWPFMKEVVLQREQTYSVEWQHSLV